MADIGWRFDNTYSRLPDDLWAAAAPAKARNSRITVLNERLAADLGLNFSSISPEAVASLFAGQTLPPGSRPIAQAYAGHQYGGFTMLGDGRAILLGEQRTPGGQLVDIQFKGSGRTQFSRGGDGFAALGPMLREYIISEAMHALGIPTTRSLAVVTTGETVYRTTSQKGAILTRVAASHIRVGTFEYAVRRGEPTLRALADYAIERHYPELVAAPDKYLAFLRAVCDRQAALVARWLLIGFVHGVMNTDNVAISGETIDYGPCAFMNAYDPATVFSSIDAGGRYAFGNQPGITQWNLTRFAETLLPLMDSTTAVANATEILEAFPAAFDAYWLDGMRKKIGLQTEEAGDSELIDSLLANMLETRADFTNTFRDLSSGSSNSPNMFGDWYARWQDRLGREGNSDDAYALMRSVNPAVIPRNYLVEEALAAAEQDNLTPLHDLLAAITRPYEGGDRARYAEIPPPTPGYRTFCGT